MNQDLVVEFLNFYDMVSSTNTKNTKIWIYASIFILVVLVGVIIYLCNRVKQKVPNNDNNILVKKLDTIINLLDEKSSKKIPKIEHFKGYTANGNLY
jgi:hypothetical protein